VLKLGELGQLAELKRKWWKEMHGGGNCEKSDEDGGDTPELGLENVGGVFLVLGLGLLAAMVLGCTEFLWNVKSVAIEEKVVDITILIPVFNSTMLKGFILTLGQIQ